MLTVLMATFNRARILQDVLESYLGLAAPPGGWKAVIVDNGSQDDTRQVVESFSGKLPLEYVREERRGKTSALNTGLSRVEGGLLVLTDDDILPPAHWLTSYNELAELHPEFDIFGGPIIARWPGVPPAWAIANRNIAAATYCNTLQRHPDGPLEDFYSHLLGGNYAVRTRVIQAGFHFDRSIGPTGSAVFTSSDETEFLMRLQQAGYRCWFDAGNEVEHIVRPEQFRKDWVLRRAVQCGRGWYRIGTAGLAPPAMLLGVPRHTIRQIATQALRVAGAVLSCSSQKVFEERWQLNYYLGYAFEGRRLYGRGTTPGGPV